MDGKKEIRSLAGIEKFATKTRYQLYVQDNILRQGGKMIIILPNEVKEFQRKNISHHLNAQSQTDTCEKGH